MWIQFEKWRKLLSLFHLKSFSLTFSFSWFSSSSFFFSTSLYHPPSGLTSFLALCLPTIFLCKRTFPLTFPFLIFSSNFFLHLLVVTSFLPSSSSALIIFLPLLSSNLQLFHSFPSFYSSLQAKKNNENEKKKIQPASKNDEETEKNYNFL